VDIRAVIFDIGHLPVEWHPARPFDRLPARARREEPFAKVDFESMNARRDPGADPGDEVRALAVAHPEDADDILIWHDHRLEMPVPDPPRSIRLIWAFRARGMPMRALSDFGAATLALADRRYAIPGEFDSRSVSGHLGLVKPAPAIYAYVEEGLGPPGEAPFFTDDRPENVEATAARGWRARPFGTPAGLADRSRSEDLLSVRERAA